MLKKTLVLLSLLVTTHVVFAQAVSLRGSDSMLMLGQRWSQRLSMIFPQAKMSVNGGGLQTAVSGMSKGSVDIIQSSRKLSGTERQAIGAITIEFPVAIESVVFYVNDANPLRELTISQLREIYLGKIDNWKTVGGPDLAISLVSLETFVGGSPFVKEILLDGQEVDTSARGYSNPNEMAEHIAREKGSIGFGSLLFTKGIHTIAVKKGNNFPAISPTSVTIRSMDYPLSRFLYWSVKEPLSPNLQKISAWVLSSGGQLVVESLGYYPLDAASRSKGTGLLSQSR